MPRSALARALLLVPVFLATTLTSCRTVEPDGPLKNLVDGELFTGDATTAPSRHENDVLVEPPDTGGPVRWKVRF
jgi:hypothetical protein